MMKILVVDDDAVFLKDCLQMVLTDQEIEMDCCNCPDEAVGKVASKQYDLALLDVSFTPNNREGLDLIKDVKGVSPDTDIIMLSGISDRQVILDALERGATNYVIKSGESHVDELVFQINSILAKKRAKEKRLIDGQAIANAVGAVFKSEKMRGVFSTAMVAGNAKKINVLVTGATGSGKELVAKAVASCRPGKKLVVVNCGAISENLIESELFGHVKGAFTGAIGPKNGYFVAADHGDIFLDEVDSLSSKAQVALLRVLQSGDLIPVGGTKSVKVNVRVIAATNANLLEKVERGEFREDLYARLKGLEINIPPLADRREDIPLIVQSVIARSDKPDIKVGSECMAFLQAYGWPQNVRQLIQTVESMIAFSTGRLLSIGDIPKFILSESSLEDVSGTGNTKSDGEIIHLKIPDDVDWVQATKLFQTQFITHKIKTQKGPVNQRSLAESLGLSKGSIHRRLTELKIDLQECLQTN